MEYNIDDTNDNHNNEIEIQTIFYDGETEIDLGKLAIIPSMMSFKFLQFILSNIIGISPNQFTVYLDFDNVNFNHNRHRRRRRPVTSKFNFSALRSVESFFFWVVLKRSRHGRRRYRNYLMSLNLNPNVYVVNNQSNYDDDDFGSSSSSCSSNSLVFCDVCFNNSTAVGGGDTVPFHWCKNDVVTTGFRSPVGPIAPPSKNKASR